MKMSDLLIVLLSALVCFASAKHIIPGRNFRGNATISAKGPHMKIDLTWETFQCVDYGTPIYETIYYDEHNQATTIGTGIANSLFIESPIPDLGPLNILFWNRNRIKVWAICKRRREVERFVLDDLPGELLPVEAINFEPRENGGILTWTLSKLQNAATHVLVKTCPSREEENCTPEIALPITQTNYTIEGLTPGIPRTVFVRLGKKKEAYFSDFVTATIEAFPPTEDIFPPVENLTAEIIRKGPTDSDVKISYSKPQKIPSGTAWWGIEARIVDLFGNIVLEGFRTQDLQFVKTGLDLFTDMTVEVRAVYSLNGEEVLSEEKTYDFYTGSGHLEKPQFRVDAIDDTKALVRWTHEAKDTFETNFTISWDGGNQKEVLMSKKTYAVIDGLVPGKQYNVNITAHIVHGSNRSEKTSDTKPVTLLQEGALKPRASCKNVGPEGLEINWEVEMPDDPRYCRFAIRICPDNVASHCKQRVSLHNELRNATVDFFPFENQTVEVVTTCNYYYDVIVSKVSEPLLIDGTYKLSAVQNLTVKPLDDTSVQITFQQIENEAPFVGGYKIRWLQQGLDVSQAKDETTNEKSYVLRSLKPATTYDISVAPFNSGGNQVVVGFESQEKVLTQLPVPPSVTDLQATQKAMSYEFSLDWKMPQYAYDIVYEIEAVCGAWSQNFTSDSTKFTVNVTANHGENCKFFVKAATNVPPQTKRTAKETVVEKMFEGLEPPQDVRMTGCLVKFKYDFEIVPPESAKSLDIRYQFAEVSTPYKGLLKENLVSYRAYPSGVTIEVKARICYGGVCSTDKNLKFMTNSGGPGAIDSMKMTILRNTNILMQWSKPRIALGPIDGYRIVIKDEETKIVTAETLPGNETSYTFESDGEHVEYTIEYYAFNNNRCGAGRFSGTATTANFLTSGIKFPPPKELHTGSIGTQRGIYWNPPENTEVNKFHVVGTPAPTGENILPKGNSDLVDRFTTEPMIPFRPYFKPYTRYSIEISSCSTVDVSSCGRSYHYETQTDVGHPSRPKARIAEKSESTISVILISPEEPAGPIDGYRVAYVEKSRGESPTNWQERKKDVNFATLQNLTEGTEYVIHVQAYNLDPDHKPLFSPVAVLNAETRGGVGSASAVTVVVSILFVVVLAAVVGAAGFKMFKRPRSDDTQPLGAPFVDLSENRQPTAEY